MVHSGGWQVGAGSCLGAQPGLWTLTSIPFYRLLGLLCGMVVAVPQEPGQSRITFYDVVLPVT